MNKYYCCHLASRFVAVLALVILGTVSSLATPLSEGEALQRAIAFMQQRGKAIDLPSSVRRSPAMTESATGSTPDAYYVFNLQDEGGFVVVSGDDRTPAILGYADSGSFNAEALPDGLRYLLDGYAEQMAWLDAHPEYAAQDVVANRAATTRHPVAPLIETRWDQGAPYNLLCPMLTANVQAVTGCVATAMAQAMYFYKHPDNPTDDIPGYTTKTKNMPSLPASDGIFDWNNMATTYATNATGASADAVALLMQYCGSSLRMNYNGDSEANRSSSAYNVSVCEMLKQYFGYDADYVQRQHYTYQQWVDLMYREMAAGRPVVFGGQSVGGGHSFVCDGYESGDYFHINWGWGGDSDGYFRLSALNPAEQGLGGSSTLDGFSYSQDAVIGIMPRPKGSATVPPQRLSLDALQFDANGSTATQTVTRTAATDAFPISLYYMVFSYLYDTNSFDVAVQMVDAEDNLVCALYETSNEGTSITFNKGIGSTFSSNTAAGLGDGTYFIKVMSRAHGTDDWQECYDGAQQQIEATVNGNTMTLSAPFVSGSTGRPQRATITVAEENPKVGYELEVIASVTGGATDFNSDIYLYVDGQPKMGKMVDIPAGQTVDVRFVYTPDAAGEDMITIRVKERPSDARVIIGTETITIGQSDATNDIELQFSANITNQNAYGKLYGNAFRATVTVTNPSTENSYAGRLNCSVREWTETDNGDGSFTWTWNSIGVTQYSLVVEKEGTTTIDVAGDGLKPSKRYSVRLSYLKDNATVDALMIGVDENELPVLEVAENGFYILGYANGTTTLCDAPNAIDAGDACYADLRSISSFSGISITPSTNDNCLYLLAEDAVVPNDLSGKNVVKGTTAENIALVDEYPFYSPISFTANSISYTRTFTLAADRNKGWNTIMLPFVPASIKVGEDEKDWFHSASDEDKHFWLRTFTGDASGHVYFGYPTAMEANVPYLIAVPGDTWGDEWQLTGKPMVFSASNDVDIVATKDVGTPASGDYFMFCGSTAGTTTKDVYTLNEAGSKFVKRTESTAIAPFRGWFEPISISSLSLASLSIGSAATDIMLPLIAPLSQQQQIYDLQGRSVRGQAKPGIYVMGGKKVIIK
jgi:hypothetical protein